jgi:hypothetical protein
MKNYERDLLVLYRSERINDDLLQHEVECLHKLLVGVESQNAFCTAHELANRTRITCKAKSILKAAAHLHLKPFHFLINKN